MVIVAVTLFLNMLSNISSRLVLDSFSAPTPKDTPILNILLEPMEAHPLNVVVIVLATTMLRAGILSKESQPLKALVQLVTSDVSRLGILSNETQPENIKLKLAALLVSIKGTERSDSQFWNIELTEVRLGVAVELRGSGRLIKEKQLANILLVAVAALISN
jgi:hypothetical protein